MTSLVIYSCVVGGYDMPEQHTYVNPSADYRILTDEDVTWSDMLDNVPHDKFNRNNLLAKYAKVFPDKLFPEYEYSLWVDGNIDIRSTFLHDIVQDLIEKDRRMALSGHFARTCAYSEMKAVAQYKLDKPDRLLLLANKLDSEGFPVNYGLTENNIILRKHNHPQVKKLMKLWWKMITTYSHRDQLTLQYCMWKEHFACDQLLPNNRNYPGALCVRPHQQHTRRYECY